MEDASTSALIVKFKKLADVGQNYDYQISCANEQGKKCSGVCDIDTLSCQMKGLTSARQHKIALVACFKPPGSSGQPVCGSQSPPVMAWTLPLSTSGP